MNFNLASTGFSKAALQVKTTGFDIDAHENTCGVSSQSAQFRAIAASENWQQNEFAMLLALECIRMERKHKRLESRKKWIEQHPDKYLDEQRMLFQCRKDRKAAKKLEIG